MEFQLNEDFIKDNNLTEEQVKAVSGYVASDYLPTIKKEWDGKANENAEGIINGALKSIQNEFGLELDREQGEKAVDYLTRFSSKVVGSKQSELDELKSNYEEKIKGVKGAEALQGEYEKMKLEKDEILKKYADYDDLKEKADKYEEASQTLSTLKLEVAFNGVKPQFPNTVNKYEADAKWNEFKKGVLSNYTIEIVDNVPTAIDKENHHKTIKLEDLLSKDESIQELMKGRQQPGTGAEQKDLVDIEGIPFKLPVNAGAKDRSKAISEYLTSKGLTPSSNKWADEFAELNKKILQGKNQAD